MHVVVQLTAEAGLYGRHQRFLEGRATECLCNQRSHSALNLRAEVLGPELCKLCGHASMSSPKVSRHGLALHFLDLGVQTLFHVADLLLEALSRRRDEIELFAVLGAEDPEGVLDSLIVHLKASTCAMETTNLGLNDLAPIFQACHVRILLARRRHEPIHALLNVVHEHVVLREDLFCRQAHHSHLCFELSDLLHQLLVVEVLRHVDNRDLDRTHP